MSTIVIALLVLAIMALVWVWPIAIILGSDKVSGSEKMAWILAVIFVSWFAWIFFVLMAPVSRREQ